MTSESGGAAKILLVEDNLRHAELIRDELHEQVHGAAIEIAGGVKAAIETLSETERDLIVLDFRLPDGDGLELLRWLRERGRREGVVFVTTSSSAEVAVEAMKIGADDYVVKEEGYIAILPFVVREVLERIRLRNERQSLERRLARAEHLASLNTLMVGIAHNLNNPLTTVRTFLELLPNQYTTDEEFRTSYYELVLQEVGRIRALIGSMMQAVAAAPQPDESPWHLDELMGELESYVCRAADEKGIRFEPRAESGLPPLGVGREGVKQALIVLLDNAIAFSPPGGTVRLTCRASREDAGRSLLLEVSDEGPGVATADQKRIFDPFFSTRPGGTGIGLFVAQCVARAHGGRLEVSGATPRGAVFTLALPLDT